MSSRDGRLTVSPGTGPPNRAESCPTTAAGSWVPSVRRTPSSSHATPDALSVELWVYAGSGPSACFGSGYTLIDKPGTFRFASTAPFYVEVGARKTTVRRASAQFFLDWAVEREKQVRAALQSPEQRDEVIRHHEAARRYWEEMLARSDAP